MSYVATTGGIGGEEVRDLMVAAVEHRFGQVNRLPQTIEWLTNNGSATSRQKPAALHMRLGWNLGRRPWRARKATAWPKRSCEPSSATMSGSLPFQMPKPSCACSPRG